MCFFFKNLELYSSSVYSLRVYHKSNLPSKRSNFKVPSQLSYTHAKVDTMWCRIYTNPPPAVRECGWRGQVILFFSGWYQRNHLVAIIHLAFSIFPTTTSRGELSEGCSSKEYMRLSIVEFTAKYTHVKAVKLYEILREFETCDCTRIMAS